VPNLYFTILQYTKSTREPQSGGAAWLGLFDIYSGVDIDMDLSFLSLHFHSIIFYFYFLLLHFTSILDQPHTHRLTYSTSPFSFPCLLSFPHILHSSSSPLPNSSHSPSTKPHLHTILCFKAIPTLIQRRENCRCNHTDFLRCILR
jgi:hypothetical protein